MIICFDLFDWIVLQWEANKKYPIITNEWNLLQSYKKFQNTGFRCKFNEKIGAFCSAPTPGTKSESIRLPQIRWTELKKQPVIKQIPFNTVWKNNKNCKNNETRSRQTAEPKIEKFPQWNVIFEISIGDWENLYNYVFELR